MSKPNYSASDQRLMKACGVATDRPESPCLMCEAHEVREAQNRQEIAALHANEVLIYAQRNRAVGQKDAAEKRAENYRTRMWMAVLVAAFLVAHALYVAQH